MRLCGNTVDLINMIDALIVMEVWTQIRAQAECYMKMKADTR